MISTGIVPELMVTVNVVILLGASAWMLSRPGSLGGLLTEPITIGPGLAAAAIGKAESVATATAAAAAIASMAAMAARRGRRRITVKLHSGGRSEHYRNITFPAPGATVTSFVN